MITEIKIYPETNSVQVISTEGAVQFTAENDVLDVLLIACELEIENILQKDNEAVEGIVE